MINGKEKSIERPPEATGHEGTCLEKLEPFRNSLEKADAVALTVSLEEGNTLALALGKLP